MAKIPPCDTCGAPAVECCVDIRRNDQPGDKWKSYEPIAGSERAYCAAHLKPSRSFDQNGNEEASIRSKTERRTKWRGVEGHAR